MDPTSDDASFLRETVTALAGTLEGAVGPREAERLLGHVAARIARSADSAARRRDGGGAPLDAEGVGATLCALKARIGGDFSVTAITSDRIELCGRRCPFGAAVAGRESLCAVTTGVFGRIAAEHLGFARVDVTASIARGDPACRVVIWRADGPGRTGRAFEGSARR